MKHYEIPRSFETVTKGDFEACLNANPSWKLAEKRDVGLACSEHYYEDETGLLAAGR